VFDDRRWHRGWKSGRPQHNKYGSPSTLDVYQGDKIGSLVIDFDYELLQGVVDEG
jgi:hypothetical protein